MRRSRPAGRPLGCLIGCGPQPCPGSVGSRIPHCPGWSVRRPALPAPLPVPARQGACALPADLRMMAPPALVAFSLYPGIAPGLAEGSAAGPDQIGPQAEIALPIRTGPKGDARRDVAHLDLHRAFVNLTAPADIQTPAAVRPVPAGGNRRRRFPTPNACGPPHR